MVRRLIEQQQIGTGKEQPGERHAHPPAARKRRKRLMLVGFIKSKPSQNACRPCGGAMSIDQVKTFMDIGDFAGVSGGVRPFEQLDPLLIGS